MMGILRTCLKHAGIIRLLTKSNWDQFLLVRIEEEKSQNNSGYSSHAGSEPPQHEGFKPMLSSSDNALTARVQTRMEWGYFLPLLLKLCLVKKEFKIPRVRKQARRGGGGGLSWIAHSRACLCILFKGGQI